MSSSKEIQDFLKTELYSMASQIEGDFSLGEKHDNDYYYNLDSDDRDSCYYENEIGNIIHNIEEQTSELENSLYDYEYDFNYEELNIHPEIKSKLIQAKEYRQNRQHLKSLELCFEVISDKKLSEITSEDKKERYAINLIIANYNDINDDRAYILAKQFLNVFCNYNDFINTVLGVLGKANKQTRYDELVSSLIVEMEKYCLNDLRKYMYNLSTDNPMRTHIMNTIKNITNDVTIQNNIKED